MKRFSIACLLLPTLFALPACSGEEAQAKMNELGEAAKGSLQSLKDLDVSKLSMDQLKTKASEIASQVVSELGKVKDAATAENVKKELQPAVDALSKVKTALGDKMPSMSSLKSTIDGLMSKFTGDEKIMSVLQPLLDKLKALIA